MKHRRSSYLIVAIIIVGVCFYWFILRQKNNSDGSSIIVKGHKINIEIAKSFDERKKGLSGKNGICESCGMLFVFEKPGKYSFLMKDMNFSLDIIWIMNEDVVYIAQNIPHDYKNSISPNVLADKVLEINGGIVKKLGLKIGDKIGF